MNAVTETRAEHSSIAAALAAAQAEMGKALKQANNPHFRSKYADLGNVVGACMPALNRHGIAVIQPTIDDESGRYVETRLIHSGGETLSCRVPLIVQKNDMQGYGSAVTYARRYGLMCMAGIAPEDDDGNAAAAAPPREDRRQQRPHDDSPSPAQTAVDSLHSDSTHDTRGADPVQIAIDSLSVASTLGSLASIWSSVRAVQTDPRVIAAKDKRKDELTPAITDDEVPY